MRELRTKLFIANEWRDAISGDRFSTVDPSSGVEIAKVARAGVEDIDAAVSAASAAMEGPWASRSPAERGAALFRLADLIEAQSENLAAIETLDVGKPLSDSRGDMAGVVATFRYNAGAADKLEGATIPMPDGYHAHSIAEPVGVTAHITPWNYPLGMAARSVAPALAAGCTVVLKPAEQSPLSSLALAELCVEAGLPAGVVNVVTGFGEEAGAALVAHPLVRGVTFTGSVDTGRTVYQSAGAGLKKVVLELGGKNPMVVFPDADLDRAAMDAVSGAFANSGQVCSAASLLVLHSEIWEPFLERFEALAQKLTIGPGAEDYDLGPLASQEQYVRVQTYLTQARKDRLRIRFGGNRPSHLDGGFFILPTLVECTDMNFQICREEVFGPIAVAVPFSDERDVLDMVNKLEYGLVAGVYTNNIARAMRLSRMIQCGTIWINGWYIGGAQVPTGGNKASGIGRERGLPGIMNYVEFKNVGIRL